MGSTWLQRRRQDSNEDAINPNELLKLHENIAIVSEDHEEFQ